MKFKALIAAIALALTAPVFAQITTVALAHEVNLNDVRFPQSTSGTIGFKACSECEYATKRVSDDTRWVLNGQPVTLERFRDELGGTYSNSSCCSTARSESFRTTPCRRPLTSEPDRRN